MSTQNASSDGGDRPIILSLADGIAEITLNRPQAKNSLRLADMRLLSTVLEQALAAPSRCLLLAGAGDAFSAGRDLKETDPVNDDTHAIIVDLVNPILKRLREAPVPTIAAVKGPALGFGFGLAFACDITLVADNAVLGSPFRNIGAVLDSGGHHVLRERVGAHRAAELIYTGRLINGTEAAAMGLVNGALPASEVEAAARAMARSIADGPTAAFRASKRILAEARSFDEVVAMEAVAQAEAFAGPDGREGVAAFKERRKPRFIGR
jgi:enoyl-CoA hydratase/carnithine racemase